MTTDETGYYTISEAAELLKVSTPTVWRWVNSGRLPALRIGAKSIRIRRSDLTRVIEPVSGGNSVANMERYVLRLGGQETSANVVKALRKVQDRILARRRGRPLGPSSEVIRAAREERSARL